MRDGFEEVASLDCDTTITIGGSNKASGKSNPTELEGYYLGTKQVPSALSKSGFSDLHVFLTSEGNTGVWGKAGLNKKLAAVTPGQYVAVEFTGMKKIKNFPPMYTYKVGVRKGDTIDVASVSSNASAAEELDQEEEGLYDDSSANDAVSYVAPKAAASPVPPSAQAQAKARALLGATRKS